jgi:hypothetical protein
MKSRSTRHRQSVKPALSSIGLAVVATLIAGGANAATASTGTSVTSDQSSAMTNGVASAGALVNENKLTNPSAVTALIDQGVIVSNGSGSQANTSNAATSNSLNALAIGNSSAPISGLASIDLALRGTTSLNGLVAHNVLVDAANITSTVNASVLSIGLSGSQTGTTAVNNANTIGAMTTVNSTTASIAGIAGAGVSGSAKGTSTVNYKNPSNPSEYLSQTTGDIDVATVQQSNALQSRATASSNLISVGLTSNSTTTPGAPVDAAVGVAGNVISATFNANSAANTAHLQSGGAPAYTGSVVVTNVQSQGQPNASASASAMVGSAINSDSGILGNVTGNVSGNATGSTAGPLQGALSVTGNAITSAATGNQATNRTLLDGTLSFVGNGASPASVETRYDNSANPVKVVASADLLTVNSQNNFNATVASQTYGSVQFTPSVPSVKNGIVGSADVLGAGSTIAVSGNSISSAANGNVVTSSIANGGDAASFRGTAALVNQQKNDRSSVRAVTQNTVIAATAGTQAANGAVNNAAVTVENNNASATAFGNQATQNLVLDATSLSSVGGTVVMAAAIWSTAASVAGGTATVVNQQANIASSTSAYNVQSQIGLAVDSNASGGHTLSGNALKVADNTQQAVAVGSIASNALSYQGATIGSGIGLLNVQSGDNTNSDVTAGLSFANTSLYAGTQVDSSSALSLTNNLQRAIAYGTSATNMVSVAGNTLVLPATSGGTSSQSRYTLNYGGSDPTVAVAYGLLNSQSLATNITASTTPVLPSSVMPSTGTVQAGGTAPIGILLEGNLKDSKLNNDSNSLIAAAYGNNVTNGMMLKLDNVTTSGFVSVANVTNAQTVNERQLVASATGGRIVGTQIDYDTVNSGVSTTGNAIQALVVGNGAANQLVVAGGNVNTPTSGRGTQRANSTSEWVDATFSVMNLQSITSDLTATQRMDNGTGLASSTGIVIGRSDLNGHQITNSSVVADLNESSASATANSAANALSLTVNTAGTTSALQNVQLMRANMSALIGQAGTNTTPNQGGVTLTVAGTNVGITGSILSVSANTTSGSVTGNTASNSLSVAANSITNGLGNTNSQGNPSITGLKSVAGHGLTNRQQATGNLNSNVFGSFGIAPGNPITIASSTLLVTGNTQTSSAVANLVTNALSLGETDTTSISGGSALMSLQLISSSEPQALVKANSSLDLFAPVGVDKSAVAITGNTNSARAAVNEATNASTITATNVASIAGNTPNATRFAGDNILGNQQSIGNAGVVNSVARTNLYNQEGSLTSVAPLVSSAVAVSGNTTLAQAYANTALNSLSVLASASQGSNASLSNDQNAYYSGSPTSVTASATTVGKVSLPGAVNGPALNASTIDFVGNTTVAQAIANTAINALVMTAGSGYTTSSTAASSDASGTQATAIVTNGQYSNGPVTASSTATYQVALNAGGAINGTINVTGNVAAAQAYGNSANNSITLSALNGITPTAALSSYQTNSGVVNASVTSAYYGSSITGGATGTGVRVSGNQTLASATGNSVVSAIVASR